MVELAGGVGDGSGIYSSVEAIFAERTRAFTEMFEGLRTGDFLGEAAEFEILTVFTELVFCSEAFDVKIEIITGSVKRHKILFKTNF